MKEKHSIQKTWGTWFDAYAASQGFPPVTKSAVRVELAKEIDWAVRCPSLEDSLTKRLAKIASQLEAHENDLSSFDSVWQARKALLEWMAE